MSQPQLLQIKLSRFDAQPWGFRLQGGVDFAQPLLVQKVNAGSLSEQAGLLPGDAVIKINEVDVFNFRHKDAQDIVVRSGNNFVITVQRGGSTWRPHVTPTGNVPQPNSPYLQTVTKTSLAHQQQDSQHIGCGYNNSARPFANGGGDGGVKSIVNKQYNTPVGIYSDESIAETLSAQAEVLAGGVLGVNFKKNEKEYQADRSEVLKFLREEETGQSTPEPHSPANFYWTQSHAIGGNERRTPLPTQLQRQDERIGTNLQSNTLAPAATHRPSLPVAKQAGPEGNENTTGQQQQQQQPQQEQPDPRIIVMPICPVLQSDEYKADMEAAAAALASDAGAVRPLSASGHPACQLCGVGIVGVFVRIKDKNLHVECFKCATCGTSLKNQGYYNFNNKLYCDIHAKLAAQNNPPAGTEGYVPVPIKPNTKLSANTISSALNSHGYGSNGYANGNSTPTPAPVSAPVAADNNNTSNSNNNNNDNNNIITSHSTDNMSSNLTLDEQSSIYGQAPVAPPLAGSANTGDQPFEYVTLTGNVIRSVQAPGKGSASGAANYKVNQGYARPYGAAAPKSPVSYPPQQQQQSPRPAPIPAGNPYATLPRSNVGQQETEEEEGLQPQYAEECYEEDIEVAMAASRRSLRGSSFTWPPPQDDSHAAPTAAPLYIAPPETQHIVVANPVQEVPPLPPGSATARLDPQPQCQPHAQAQIQAQSQVPQWQSYSAPQLTNQNLRVTEQESSSDSYTSTSTTTTTTSEEYQRMYAAQVQAYQMQEQSGSEFDYQLDYGSMQDVQEYASGRRSAQECVDSLSAPLSTYKLIDLVREVTPSPVPTPVPAPPPNARHVVFNDEPEIKELPKIATELETIPESSAEAELMLTATEELAEEDRDGLIIEHRCQILESERMFQPTPEIKFEIAPVRQIPPTRIPNPSPKEWINPMIRVLTTAPEVPFHLVECPFPKPCDDEFEARAAEEEALRPAPAPVPAPAPAPPPEPVYEAPPLSLRESPPRGSRLSQAMVTAPEFELRFAPPADQGIPLPEETEPYMPPPIDMKPYMREDYRPKSPFVSALTTAPERPFEGHFDRDVPIHLIDLPTPKEHLSMGDALCIAPDRGYTPLNPENATQRVDEEQKQKELKKHEFQVLDHEEELGIRPEPPQSVEYYITDPKQKRKSSAFAAMQAFQPSREPLTSSASTAPSTSTTPRASIASLSREQTDLEYQKYCKAQERNQKRLDYFQKKEEELQRSAQSQSQQETQQQQQQIIEQNTRRASEISTKASATFNSSSIAQQSTTTNATTTSAYVAQSSAKSSHTSSAYGLTALNTTELIEETADELEHSEVLFPPPSPLSHLKQGKPVQSGLHKADTIPKYQRNWTVLPTQSPIRTPEPQELRDNVPLAFVDTPKAETIASTGTTSADPIVHRPIAQTKVSSVSAGAGPTAAAAAVRPSPLPLPKPSVPIIVEDRSGPVTMAFQSLDEYDRPDQSQTPTRPFTPSLINKPAPIIPFYQTPEKLCFEEYRVRSPAPGPPPNPLSTIRAPRMKEPESTLLAVGSGPRLQTGSITTGQSYQGQLLAHSEQSSQSGSQSYSHQPETLTERRIGNLNVQQREQSSQFQQQQQSQMQSQTKTQVGNTQIERRRKVTEEFERTQSAKTIEIRTGSQTQTVSQSGQSESTERRSSYGKTGYVANQARRLSGLEQVISSLTSQSQSISARASAMAESNFPQLRSPTFDSKFPLKPATAESIVPGYAPVGAGAANKLLGPPPGFLQQQQQQLQQQQQQQQQQKSAFQSTSSLTSTSAIATSSSSRSAAASSSILTKASAITTTTNNQACSAFRSNSITGNNNNNKPNLANRPSIASITAPAPAPAPGPTVAPVTKSIIAAATATPPSTSSTAPAVFPPNLSDLNLNSNVTDTSVGGGKNGAFGATSAPKRGRGILNKAAGPGVRIPLCNSCNVQIRGPFITALGRIWCPDHFICVNGNCRRPLQDIGFVEEKGDLYCEYCFEKYLAPQCSKCAGKIKGDCLNAIGKHFHPECFTCGQCGKIFGNRPFFLEDGNAYCEADWNELFTTKCFACGFPVEAGDRWVEALNHNYHSQCFNCTFCKQNLEGQSFYNKGGRPFCKNHAR
ncbi:PDZ and LIM domain protein Zasp isoform X2 [Drosophila willistoni]|uniref:PDZ and LIM domain protein Zasp isoform X2 n=1 Tax=Drosophila willistoni TaxID=7260 RepID=UPI000C26D45A|nr:PDZ and LIM domain protein Zasp isoform X2 [Drosophila willistoni]